MPCLTIYIEVQIRFSHHVYEYLLFQSYFTRYTGLNIEIFFTMVPLVELL